MGHIQTPKSYLDLQQRLDKSPQGAPASDSLFRILEILFTEEEARLASVLPIRNFTVKMAAKLWKKSEAETAQILNTFADKGILADIFDGKVQQYFFNPTMAGFFEFSLMRTDGRFDRKILSELYHQYINVEEDFIHRALNLVPPIDRVFAHEDQIPEIYHSEVLDYERASKVIETATCITVGTCYCRHKMEHLGKACDNPQDVCLTFNGAAESLSKHGIARQISKEEAYAVLDRVQKLGLVQVGDNVKNQVNWICNCCGCCCEALLAYKRLGYNPKIHSNFEAEVDPEACTHCGLCAKKCPVDAITMVGDSPKTALPQINYDRCIGCGVCTRFCPSAALKLRRRSDGLNVPKDSFERFVCAAINTGKLQNLVFDNYQLWTHRVMRKFLEIILKLPPIQRDLAQNQLKSRFLRRAVVQYEKQQQILQ